MENTLNHGVTGYFTVCDSVYLKNSTRPGIKPRTFRYLGGYANHYTTEINGGTYSRFSYLCWHSNRALSVVSSGNSDNTLRSNSSPSPCLIFQRNSWVSGTVSWPCLVNWKAQTHIYYTPRIVVCLSRMSTKSTIGDLGGIYASLFWFAINFHLRGGILLNGTGSSYPFWLEIDNKHGL